MSRSDFDLSDPTSRYQTKPNSRAGQRHDLPQRLAPMRPLRSPMSAQELRATRSYVVNSELALPPGKMAAQVRHASIAAFPIADDANRQKWLDVGMPKIVLATENEAQMHLLLRGAREAGVPAYLVRDAGRTVIPEGT